MLRYRSSKIVSHNNINVQILFIHLKAVYNVKTTIKIFYEYYFKYFLLILKNSKILLNIIHFNIDSTNK